MTALATTPRHGECTDAEWETRVELAAAFRLAHQFGWTLAVWNHISARVPGNEEHFLLNPLGLRYEEITASNLVKVDVEGNVVAGDGLVPKPGFVIHGAIHKSRPDAKAVMHTHTNDGIAVSVLKDGLLPLSNEALYVYNRIGYHEYGAAAMDVEECDLLAANLGETNVALILRNHGLLTLGGSVAECFTLMYWLQKACEVQMKVLASGADYEPVSATMIDKYTEQINHPRDDTEQFFPGHYEWPAWLRMLDGIDPSYRS